MSCALVHRFGLVLLLLCASIPVLVIYFQRRGTNDQTVRSIDSDPVTLIGGTEEDPDQQAQHSPKIGVQLPLNVDYDSDWKTTSGFESDIVITEISPEFTIKHQSGSDSVRSTTTKPSKTIIEPIEKSARAEIDYLNPFVGSQKYATKKICRSSATWMDITHPWSLLSSRLGENCSLIYGNLVIARLTDDDDVTALEHIEEISGYLIIHSVGRSHVSLPNLRLIRGQEFVQVKNRRVAMLVSNNYLDQDAFKSTESVSADATEATEKHISFLTTLEIPRLISIIQHGVYFYDNPGLCYAPFTINWADLLESAELQTVDLYPVHAKANLTRWLIYCHCRYSNNCTTLQNDVHGNLNNSLTLNNNSATNITVGEYGDMFVTTTSEPVTSSTNTVAMAELARNFPSETTAPSLISTLNEALSDIPESPLYRAKHMARADEDIAPHPEVLIAQQTESITFTETSMLEDQDPLGTNMATHIVLPTQLQPTLLDRSKSALLESHRPEEQQSDLMVKMNFIEPESIGDVKDSVLIDSEDYVVQDEPAKPDTEEPKAMQPKRDEGERIGVTNLEETFVATPAPLTELIESLSTVYSTKLPDLLSTVDSGETAHPTESHISNSSSIEALALSRGLETSTLKLLLANHSLTWLNRSQPVQEMLNGIRLPCHPTCPLIHGSRYCWGPASHHCQATYKCQVRLCDGSNWCFLEPKSRSYPKQQGQTATQNRSQDEMIEHCCHSECAAGCSGPRSTDCNACLRYNLNGSCVSSCPATNVYNKTAYTWTANPHGLLAVGWTCVKQCPTNYLREGDNCVSQCSRPGTFPQNGQCISCSEDRCPKSCKFNDIEPVKGIDYLHRSSLRAMRNCTTFQGDIKLSRQSFVGDPFHNLTKSEEGVRWSDLVEGLSELKEVTGILYISAGSDAPWLTNLTFLSKLEVIGGVSPYVIQTRTININSNQHLEFLGLTSLRSIAHPTILITGNPNLCFTESIQWDSLIPVRATSPSSNTQSTTPTPNTMSGNLRTGRLAREPFAALRDRLRKEVERQVLLKLLGRIPGKVNRPRSYRIPTIFIHGNAHPEFCRGKRASCADQCVPTLGCWGPGPSFCRACRHWTVPQSDGTRLCVDQCDQAPGYFSANRTIHYSSSSFKLGITPTPESSMSKGPISSQGQTYNASSKQCEKCSSNCRLEKNACYGPGADHCIGGCRWVKDGPFCRENCPLGKFEDLITRVCRECNPVCSVPLRTVSTSLTISEQPNNILTMCTGSGNWPGSGGCNYCRQTALRGTSDAMQLECVRACPSDTYLHVVNLHYRGGSSACRSADLYAPSIWQSEPIRESERLPPWSHTDGALFERFPPSVQQQLKSWLFNHTQSQLYGVARVCLPCHEQCARNPDGIDQPIHNSATASICSGPGPEQCVRCANASYLGRCVSHCPEGTYEIPRWKQLASAEPGQGWEELFLQINNAYLTAAVIDHSTWIQQMFNWHECLPCHSLCHSGCTGPSASHCHRCRVVKIYLNRAKTTWRCGFTCPILYKYQVRDHHTGDLVCSTRADRIRVILDSTQDSSKPSSDISQGHNQSSSAEWSEADTRLDSIQQYNVHFYLSGETAGTLAASAACLVFLLAVSGLIYWAVLQQPPNSEPEFVEWLDKDVQPSWGNRLRNACERLWTRGRPRFDGDTYLGISRKSLLNAATHVRVTKEKKYSQTMPDNWSRSDMITSLTNGTEYLLQSGSAVEGFDAVPDREKPNMATLRIITESQLIRGPLIGSGAFGTVFCGIWRPQQTTNNSDLDNGHQLGSPPSLSTRTTSTSGSVGDADWPERLELSWTESGRAVWTPSHNRGLTAATSPTTPTSTTYAEIPVAIKVLTDTADAQTNKELLEEAKVMATVDHPCCLRFLALCLTSRLQLVTQYMPLGNLLDFVKTRCDLVEVQILMRWAHQIASGMAYLAMRGIIHRDLAARNVLVESLEQVRITDFGLAKCLEFIESEYHASGGRMPIKWLAIESIQGRIFSSKSDVWAYGVTIWEMCTFGRKPYADIRARDLLGHLEQGIRLPQPETVSLEFYSVLLQCWDADPARRPNFNDLCIVMEKMSVNPSRYLFITARIKAKQRARGNRSVSDEALEFLTNTLGSCQSFQTTDNSIVSPGSDSVTETEYTQMQADWMRTLYVNSRMTAFPKCVQHLIDNNYTYLAQDPVVQPKLAVRNAQSYCTLTVNPEEFTQKSVTRPQTLALRVTEGSNPDPSEPIKTGKDSVQPVAANQSTGFLTHPCSVRLAGQEELITSMERRKRPKMPVRLEPVDEEKAIRNDQFNPLLLSDPTENTDELRVTTFMLGNKPNRVNGTSSVAGATTHVRLDDYLEPRPQLSQPTQPRRNSH